MTTSIEYLEKLIAFPTISRDTNLDLIAYVQEVLNNLGIASTLVHNEESSKANLWATIGPTHVAGIALSAHTDVVPVGQVIPLRSRN
jgi:acetylornithine deacetylase